MYLIYYKYYYSNSNKNINVDIVAIRDCRLTIEHLVLT